MGEASVLVFSRVLSKQGVAQFADDALQAVPACLEQVAPPTSPESPACASEGSHQVVPLVDMAPALQAPETPSVPLPTPAKRQRTSEALVEDPCQSGPCISLDQTPKASVARGSSEAVVVLSGDGASSSKGDQQARDLFVRCDTTWLFKPGGCRIRRRSNLWRWVFPDGVLSWPCSRTEAESG